MISPTVAIYPVREDTDNSYGSYYENLADVINLQLLLLIFKHYPANKSWEYSNFQVEFDILIEHQTLVTNSLGNVWLLEGRIEYQILGV